MRFTQLLCAAALIAVVSVQANAQNINRFGQSRQKDQNGQNEQNGQNDQNQNGGAGGATGTDSQDATGLTLLANAIQTGSAADGSVNGAQEAGQSASKTSTNNFINICSGKTLTNGLQVQGGSCNGIPMGDIPAKAAMISSAIQFPQTNGDPIAPNTDFDITVQVSNLVAGSFTNADTTYYSGPQFLQSGKVVGHTHVTVQDMGNTLNPKTALDATQFAFFKGINDDGNGNGLLKATVTGGLPAGNYRVCTMTSASNHQPVLMPVAQRGTSDDCTKFVVATDGGDANDDADGNASLGADAGNTKAGGANGRANGGRKGGENRRSHSRRHFVV
ncbi:hypothetical protein LZ554_006450 [Drepanopeziza brunnea f. sp. 'monogermtubi']|nr:hypothetical protein LZ554_006450 [Drepanopeziza brunnea f. sp. 'monogermtubi']